MTVVEVLVLWPGRPVRAGALSDEVGVWPLFVLVVDEENDAAGTRWLVDHLDEGATGATAVTSGCRWSVAVVDVVSLVLSVRMREPVDLHMEISVPAECFLGLFDLTARGATVALTTRRHARRLAGRTSDDVIPRDVVLLGCRTSGELARLADLLCEVGGSG